jgi:uncharacterized protein
LSANLILDTNVWLDWLIFQDDLILPVRHQVSDHQLNIVATAHMRAELADVLQRPYFDHRKLNIEQCLIEFDRVTKLVKAAPACPLKCKDPDDQVFIDLVMSLEPAVLLSKDKAVLKLAKRAAKTGGRMILHPKDWSMWLLQGAGTPL